MNDASTGNARKTKSRSKTSLLIRKYHGQVGEKITWINKDEEPHTVVSVWQAVFQEIARLDTDQTYTIVAGAPGLIATFARSPR